MSASSKKERKTAKKRGFRAPIKAKTKKTPLEDKMHEQLQKAGIDGYERNVRFIPKRKFEADFYWPDLKLALECDGGVWLPKGGHTSGEGYTRDRERDVEALLHGIVTVRYTSSQINSEYAINTFKRIYEARRKEMGLA